MKVEIDGNIYHCGTCYWWVRETGCTMPPSPSTVNCGRTKEDDLCEQWTEREITFFDKIDTPRKRRLRAAHYLDNAQTGMDS